MSSGIYIALSGAIAQSDALDVTANNVANAGTTAFKAERMTFGQALGRAKGKEVAYVRTGGTATDGSAGAFLSTGNPLDLALRGEGYFAVNTERGVRYTRAGNLRVDAQGTIVNGDGFALRGTTGQPLSVPPGAAKLAVGSDGTVSADGNEIGKLEIAQLAPSALAHEGASLFALRPVAPGQKPAAPAEGAAPPEVVSGALEAGNFNVVRGMVDLVRISRTYDALHRMIESYKQIDDRTARMNGNG